VGPSSNETGGKVSEKDIRNKTVLKKFLGFECLFLNLALLLLAKEY
jgi:hypothetical protein